MPRELASICRVLRWSVPANAVFFQDGPLRVDSGVQRGDLVRLGCLGCPLPLRLEPHRNCLRCESLLWLTVLPRLWLHASSQRPLPVFCVTGVAARLPLWNAWRSWLAGGSQLRPHDCQGYLHRSRPCHRTR